MGAGTEGETAVGGAPPAAAGVGRRRRAGDPRPARVLSFSLALALPLYFAIEGGGGGTIARSQLGILLWAAIAAGLLAGLLPRARPAAGTRRVALLFALLGGWIALGLLWTESSERTVAELTRLSQYAGLAALCWLTLSSRTWRAAAAGLSVAVAIIAVVGVGSRVAPDIVSGGLRATIGGERLNYPLEYWNALAFLAAAATTMTLAWAVYARDGLLRAVAGGVAPLAAAALYLTYSRGGALAVTVALGLLVLAAPRRRRLLHTIAIAAAGSCAAIFAIRTQPEIAGGSGGDGGALVALVLIFAVAATGWFSARPIARSAAGAKPIGSRRGGRPAGSDSRAQRRQRVLLIALPVLAAAALAVVASFEGYAGETQGSPSQAGTPPEAAAAVIDPASRLTSTDSPRWELWGTALEAAAENPLSGIGAGTFDFYWDAEGGSRERVRDAHSLYIEGLAELGIPGLLGIIALLVGLGALAWQGTRRLDRPSDRGIAAALVGVFAAFCAQAGIDWLWEIPAVGIAGFGAALIAAAAAATPRPQPRRSSRSVVLPIVLASGLVVLQVPGLVSTDRIFGSRAALAEGRPDRARELANDAIAAAPWSASAYSQRAELELAIGSYDEAREAALQAGRLEPGNWRHSMQRARIELAAGSPAAALVALEEVGKRLPAAGPFLEGLEPAAAAGRRNALERFAP